MDKRSAMLQAHDFLQNEGFSVTSVHSKSTCFDLIAKRRAFILMLKFLENIDSMTEALADDIKELSHILCAYPLLIGERTRHFDLQEGVLHNRYGINTVNMATFIDLFENEIYPLVLSARGGFYVRIDAEKLKQLRAEKNISVGDLSEHAGVSRTMIYSYENSGLGATFSTVLKLEEYLGESLTLPLEVFTPPPLDNLYHDCNTPRTGSFSELERIGFEIYPIRRAPFDAVAKGDFEEQMLTKVEGPPKKTLREIKIVKDLSEIASCLALLITESSTADVSIEGIPIIKRSELEQMESRGELLETVEQRS